MICVLTLDGRFSSVANECEQLLGYANYELISRSIYEFMGFEDLEPLKMMHTTILNFETDISRSISVRVRTSRIFILSLSTSL